MKTTIFILLFSFSALLVYGFELETGSQGAQPPFIKWDTSKGPVGITLNSNGSKDVPIQMLEQALQSALSQWQSASNQALQFQYLGRSSGAVANSNDSINSVVWIEKDWQYTSSVLAITKYTYYYGDPAYLADVDIQMNGQDFHWSLDGASTHTMNVEEVLLHEIGHACGLAHSSRYKATMYPYLQAAVLSPHLSRDDKAGIRFLYDNPPDSFAAFTPLPRAVYVKDMARKGLALPVFRWGIGLQTDFKIEFSNNREFTKPFSISTNAANYYALKPSDEAKLEAMAIKGKIWWRVVSDTLTTKAYSLRFKQVD